MGAHANINLFAELRLNFNLHKQINMNIVNSNIVLLYNQYTNSVRHVVKNNIHIFVILCPKLSYAYILINIRPNIKTLGLTII